ncbi:Phosphatidylserine synthase 2, partial [Stegodyphus mimosarum]
MVFAGAVSAREYFQCLDDPNCKTFGRQSWLMVAIIITEFLVIAKFDYETITKPLPVHIVYFWVFALCALFFWTVWKFFFLPKLNVSKLDEHLFLVDQNYQVGDGNLIENSALKKNGTYNTYRNTTKKIN